MGCCQKKKNIPEDILKLSEKIDESTIKIKKGKDESTFSELNKSSEIESTKDEINESFSILVNNENNLNVNGKSENEEEKKDEINEGNRNIEKKDEIKENEHERNIEDDNKINEYEKSGENKNIKNKVEEFGNKEDEKNKEKIEKSKENKEKEAKEKEDQINEENKIIQKEDENKENENKEKEEKKNKEKENKINEENEEKKEEKNEEIKEEENKKETKKNPYYFLSDNIEDFHDDNYNFEKRKDLPHKIICPKNIIKEMISNFTKKLPSPVYFNEPISMGQKQCEKFKYMDLLIKAGVEPSKEKQMCYIAAFLIGEIFLNIGRSLKPFNPIIGETYEYFDNEKKFRFYSEQVTHNPQVNAYIAETPEFAYYGDTLNTTSFKFFKGAIELIFKNKAHIHCKKTGDHYIFNPPNIYVKGLMKPPLYNDYVGNTIIQNTTDTSYRCELKFIEEGWTPDSLGVIEGTVFKDYETIVYLLKGNWQKEIYMTDPEGNNRIDLLTLDENQEYLKNTTDSYIIPEYTCRLNQITPELEKILPKNDSRFRLDIRNLEEKTETDEAQSYKLRYEEKQRKELCGEDHKILFFTELLSPETEDKYYIPNGKYWEYRKEGKIIENENNKILNLEGY